MAAHHAGADVYKRQDRDIYADYLWGVITGYDAEAALRMVRNAREPLVIRSAVSTLREVGSGKWFDAFAYVDDRDAGRCLSLIHISCPCGAK